MKEPNKYIQTLQQIFLTHLGRIVLGALLFFFGLIMAREGGAIGELVRDPYKQGIDWWLWIGRIGGVLMVGEGLLMMVYAWIINPIRERRNKKK